MKTRGCSTAFALMASVACAAWLTFSGAVSAAEIPAPDLTGFVKSTDGRALANASIFIYTAGPRVGVGYI